MLTALFAVALLDAHGVPLQGEALVDGAWCAAQACPLEPGRHVLQDGRTRHAFYLAPGQAAARVIASDVPAHYGVWMRRQGELPDRVELPDVTPGVRALSGYTLAGALPESVRVARHADNNCGNPIERIDEVPLESYVAGVVHGEIGVFRAAGTGAGVSIPRAEVDGRVLASFETFAIAARTYVVWWVLRKGADADFHILTALQPSLSRRSRPISEEAAALQSSRFWFRRMREMRSTRTSMRAAVLAMERYRAFETLIRFAWRISYPTMGSSASASAVGAVTIGTEWRTKITPFSGGEPLPCARGVPVGSLEGSVRGDSSAEILAHYQLDLTVYSPCDQGARSPRLEVLDGRAPNTTGLRVEPRREDDQPIEFSTRSGRYEARFSRWRPGSEA